MAQADLQGLGRPRRQPAAAYARRIKAGGFSVDSNIHVMHQRADGGLNGDNGMGHLVMKRAAEIAIEKARITGIAGVIAVQQPRRPGLAYASMPLAHDMIGLYFAVGNANHLPPWGGLDMLLSTYLIAAAIPAGEEKPLVLDMATTVAAYGKVKTKALRGEMMPGAGRSIAQGKPLTDPKRADEGMLLPLAAWKRATRATGLP